MHWFAILLAPLFLLCFITRLPLEALLLHFRVIAPPTTRNWRYLFYLHHMLFSWLALLPFALLLLGLDWSLQTIGLQFPTHPLLVALFTAILLCINIVQVLFTHYAARHVPEIRAYLRQPGPAHLPHTTTERLLFIPFSLTAAILEELFFRGFLITYLLHIFPRVPLVPALILAALVFGLGHFSQKWGGMLVSGILALVFGVLYTLTGSLLPGMIIHALSNLRILLIPQHAERT